MDILSTLINVLFGESFDGLLAALFAVLLDIFNALGGLDALIGILG